MWISAFFSSAQGILILSVLIAMGLALAHLYSRRLRFKKLPRSRWLSAAGGVSIASVQNSCRDGMNRVSTSGVYIAIGRCQF
ncbi:hypothetical protein [Chlorogloeopsis sp. ULAP02]|uniref:hypothetical protein n=1 Tax=Chlorogloeopsis sp. ULAP02 TaxID=3107926 RepID=UPI0031360179